MFVDRLMISGSCLKNLIPKSKIEKLREMRVFNKTIFNDLVS